MAWYDTLSETVGKLIATDPVSGRNLLDYISNSNEQVATVNSLLMRGAARPVERFAGRHADHFHAGPSPGREGPREQSAAGGEGPRRSDFDFYDLADPVGASALALVLGAGRQVGRGRPPS